MGFCARLVIAAAFLLCLSFALPISAAPVEAPAEPAGAKKCIPAEQCCQVCDKGKACGKSCIQATKTCHKGRGCACNVSELCAAGD